LAKESLGGVGDKALLFPKSSAGRLGGVLFRTVARDFFQKVGLGGWRDGGTCSKKEVGEVGEGVAPWRWR
jgi:hypothetical protein